MTRSSEEPGVKTDLAAVNIVRHRQGVSASAKSSPYHHGTLRQALIDAAEAILERDGIQALTLRAAARAAGVSHAAPAHHFGDLAGLLSELAATGYDRFRGALLGAMDAASPGPASRLRAMGRAYVAFARDHPGLFLLMFRSERFDSRRPALQHAMAAAYAALAEAAAAAGSVPVEGSPDRLGAIAAAWAIAHGLAMLLIDGRLRGLTDNTDALIDAALSHLTV